MATNVFTDLPATRVGTNVFNLSHDHKLSCKIGDLIPTAVMEVVPGDTFHLSSEIMLRFQPLIAPVMHRLNVSMHHFFVPNRVLWKPWEEFITGNEVITACLLTNHTVTDNSLGAYLGLPTGTFITNDAISALPFLAYQKIYQDWYQDENLLPKDVLDFPISESILTEPQTDLCTNIRGRAWRKDYFTSALPWAQKGQEVQIPIESGPPATGGTINELRRAIRLQEWLEKNARGGTRYIESIYSHFGVVSSDSRLQRAEFIGGTRQPVHISEVLSTAANENNNVLGTMAGHGISVESGRNFSYKAEEHGFILSIMSVTAEPAYQQGVPRYFGNRMQPFDYYWPSFAQIGEQAIMNREIYYEPGKMVQNLATFGYTPRYAEYKYMPSRVSGDFRTSLNYWHFGRIFNNLPTLNADFIDSRSTTQRPFAIQGEDDDLLCHVFHNVRAVRPMPKFGIPTI